MVSKVRSRIYSGFKYLVNLAILCWMVVATMLSYAMIVRYPDCGNVMGVIGGSIKEAILPYLLILFCVTVFNFFVERKLELRTNSRTYLTLAIIHVMAWILSFMYFSIEFYSHCGETN